jgi:hypothetical protein
LLDFCYYWYRGNYLFRFEQKLIGRNSLDYIRNEFKHKDEKLQLLNELCDLFVAKIALNKRKYEAI